MRATQPERSSIHLEGIILIFSSIKSFIVQNIFIRNKLKAKSLKMKMKCFKYFPRIFFLFFSKAILLRFNLNSVSCFFILCGTQTIYILYCVSCHVCTNYEHFLEVLQQTQGILQGINLIFTQKFGNFVKDLFLYKQNSRPVT